MSDDDLFLDLLERWEALRQQGHTVSPDELCAACPELLERVQRAMQKLQRIDAGLELHPNEHAGSGREPAAVPATWPAVPGYEILAELGRGGMGVVYQARQTSLERLVALKMILAGGQAGQQELARFRTEAEAVARLQHPHIVQIHEVGEYHGLPYFSLEYCSGGSLAQKLDGTPLPPTPAAQLVETLARAMHAAHQCGIVHRDLKPANVLLQRNSATDEHGSNTDQSPDSPLIRVHPCSSVADWIVKIADFGLAKRLEQATGPTLSGAIMGTPSYMAPEQAGGHSKQVGPPADVYALGAILYELLTGRPPFKAATPLDTLLQVVADDPVPPSRFQPRLPRDLETVCLKCLHKEAKQRYTTARELAEDLRRFLNGEPIRARPQGPWERGWRWVRRRPALTGLVAAVLLLVVGLAAGGAWAWQQAAVVEAALAEAGRLRDGYRYAEAQAVLEQAERGAADGWSRRRLGGALADLRLVRRLDDIRGRAIELADGKRNWREVDQDYEAAFREAGLGGPGEPPEQVAARVRESAVRAALVAAVDDWAMRTTDKERQDWLLEVARQADPASEDGTGGWVVRFRKPSVLRDRAELERLAGAADVSGLAPQTLLALAQALEKQGGDSVPLLRSAQDRHPADFWLMFELGVLLHNKAQRYGDAEGYIRAARALRPDSPVVHTNLGVVLGQQGKMEEADASLRRAIELDPKYALAHNNLGSVLKRQGKLEEAVACFRRALALDPKLALAYLNLGLTRKQQGKSEEAIACYRQALSLDPKLAQAHYSLGNALQQQGNLEEAVACYRQALSLDSKDVLAHYNLGIALRQQGKLEEAIACYRRALQLNPKLAQAHYTLGIALRQQGKLEEAVASYRRALALDPKDPQAHCNLGHALRQQGRFAEALAAMQQGHALGSRSPGWRFPSAAWVRDCQRLVELDTRLPALLAGTDSPVHDTERLEFARVCVLKQRFAAAAGLYVEAFAARPPLAADLRAGHRYNAACSAAQAGCGRGAEGVRLTEPEGLRWRRQALTWLRADLADRATLAQQSAPQARLEVRRTLTWWRQDPDLAGLRDNAELVKLPEAERQACRDLWAEVDGVLQRPGSD